MECAVRALQSHYTAPAFQVWAAKAQWKKAAKHRLERCLQVSAHSTAHSTLFLSSLLDIYSVDACEMHQDISDCSCLSSATTDCSHFLARVKM